MYLNRHIEKQLLKAASEYACITIYGPRQVGKSTVVEYLFGASMPKYSMDDIILRSSAKTNPRLFLENIGWPVIIDEVQKTPELFEQIKINIDKEKSRRLKNNENIELMYVLTGSNQFELKNKISESLAGRTAVLPLSTLSNAELLKYPTTSFFNPNIDILKQKQQNYKLPYRTRKRIFEDIFRGGMPEYVVYDRARELFFDSYIFTYIERDVRAIIRADKETIFLKFLEYIALRTGSQIDYSEISRSVGIDVRTVKNWLSILETSGIIVLLEPFMKNSSKRIIKSQKLYFMDTGLCAYLCKWPTAEMLERGIMSGAFYETYVVSEIIKSYYNNGLNPKRYLYYYRDKYQKEVDLIIDSATGIYPIEIKKGINPVSSNKNFDFLNHLGKNINIGLVIDSCETLMPINEKVYSCPISLIGL